MTPQPVRRAPRVGNTLAELRQLRALSLDELSRLAGVSKSMLSQIERNQANPTVAVVWRLANALGVPLGQLLDGERPALPAITTVAGHATPVAAQPRRQVRAAHPGPDRAGRPVRVVRADGATGRPAGVARRTSRARAST